MGLSALLTKIALDKGARNAALKRLPAAFAQMKAISEREAGAGCRRTPRACASAAPCVGRGLRAGPPRAVRRAGGQVPSLSPAQKLPTPQPVSQ